MSRIPPPGTEAQLSSVSRYLASFSLPLSLILSLTARIKPPESASVHLYSMDRCTSLSSSPSTPPFIACSDFSVDVILSTTASLDLNPTDSPCATSLSHLPSGATTKIYMQSGWADVVNERIKSIHEGNERIRKRCRAWRAIKRPTRRLTRLEARFRPKRMASRGQRRLRRHEMKSLEADILKRSGYAAGVEESEDNRDPSSSKTIDICKSATRRRSRMQSRNDSTRRWGRLTVQHLRRPGSHPRSPLSATRQALSEHVRDGTS